MGVRRCARGPRHGTLCFGPRHDDRRDGADIPNAQKGFRLLFSAIPFPGYKVKLEWSREEYGGNWYFSLEFRAEGWLCLALFKYFEKAPKEIYVKAEPKTGL